MAGTALALFLPQLVFVPLMQGATNRRAGARVRIIRQLSISVVEAAGRDDARDRTDDQRIDRVFDLNMGIFRLKFTMNFLMNLSTQLQIIGVLLVGGWLVHTGRLEIGGVVAFISGIGRLTDPWGDLVNYFRDVNITQVKFRLLRDAFNQQTQAQDQDLTDRAARRFLGMQAVVRDTFVLQPRLISRFTLRIFRAEAATHGPSDMRSFRSCPGWFAVAMVYRLVRWSGYRLPDEAEGQ